MTHVLVISLSRSGGKLMRMLLDGHPAVNAFPFEHWNRASKNEIPRRQIRAFGRLTPERRLATAGAAHVEQKLRRFHPRPTVDAIMRAWREAAASVPTLASMYEALARAYFGVLDRNPDAIVVNHCGSLCRFTREDVEAVYGQGRYVLTIRDPRAVFASMQTLLYRKFTIARVREGKIGATAVERHLEKLEVVDGASGYLREFCDDYRNMVALYGSRDDVVRVRFEDLVTAPEVTMRRVAEQLGLDWHPILLTPTEFGETRSANTSFERTPGAIDSRAAGDWTSRLDPGARAYIERILAGEMAALGYQMAV